MSVCIRSDIMTRISMFLCAAVILFSSHPASSVELCAALDGSASVTMWGDDFQLQLEGLAAAVENPLVVPHNGSVYLSVVTFGKLVRTDLASTLIDSPERAAEVASLIRSIAEPSFDFGHGTDMTLALSACLEQFRFVEREWIIDISTDGFHNLTDLETLMAAREDSVARGLDVLNAIGVGDADLSALQDLVWPQPAAVPPERGFVIAVDDFEAYVAAMQYKVKSEVQLTVALDIKPGSCPNPFNRGKRGVLPAAIVGSADFDVLQIDPDTLHLNGIAPLRWSYEDSATHYLGQGGPSSCFDCVEEGPDGYIDLGMKFDAQSVASLLQEYERGDCVVLTLTAELRPEFDRRALSGEDTLTIVK